MAESTHARRMDASVVTQPLSPCVPCRLPGKHTAVAVPKLSVSGRALAVTARHARALLTCNTMPSCPPYMRRDNIHPSEAAHALLPGIRLKGQRALGPPLEAFCSSTQFVCDRPCRRTHTLRQRRSELGCGPVLVGQQGKYSELCQGTALFSLLFGSCRLRPCPRAQFPCNCIMITAATCHVITLPHSCI